MRPRPIPAAKRRTPTPESDDDQGRPRFAAVVAPDGTVVVGVAIRPSEARAAIEAERDRLAALEGLDDEDDEEDDEEEDEDDGKSR